MVNVLTSESFKEKIFDYSVEEEWAFKGNMPTVIDFYASWCGPCKSVAPILDALSTEFNGKIEFYKVDTDAEQDISSAFGIRSVPSFLFIPVDGTPQMAPGAIPRQMFIEAFREIFNV
jgi:Thioredoxin domain-containing protein